MSRQIILDLLKHLKEQNIYLSLLDGGKLKINAPEGSMTPDTLSQLNKHKNAIIELLNSTQKKTSQERLPINGEAQKDGEVLTPMQRSLWLTYQFEPSSAAYNIPLILEIKGLLDVELLSKCLQSIVRRHDILRTNFIEKDNIPYQLIDQGELLVEVTEIIPERLNDYIEKECSRVFDLQKSFLFHARVFKLNKSHHVLSLCMHHIVSDGWSCGVLLNELETLYIHKGKENALQALPFQYADYSKWFIDIYEKNNLHRLEEFWRNYLHNSPALLEFPTDYTRPSQLSSKGLTENFQIHSKLIVLLRERCKQYSCTLHQILLSVFQVLLYRYSGTKDLVVGSPFANRSLLELKFLVGYFVNALPIRTKIKPAITFEEFLQNNQKNFNQVLAHQELSLEQIVAIVEPERSLSYSPLFQYMFSFHGENESTLAIPGLETSFLAPTLNTAKYDISLSIAEQQDHFIGSCQYSTDLFSQGTIKRLIENFLALLKQILQMPTKSISSYFLLTEEQYQQLLDWNNTDITYNKDKTIYTLFEDQVRSTPQVRAVSYGDEQLSFNELNQRSNRLAHHLLEQGVNNNCLVGLCIERSIDMMVGLLGILKAGAAYVPLDPAYPIDRLAYIIADSDVKYIVTQKDVLSFLQLTDNCQTVCLDDQNTKEALANSSDFNIEEPLSHNQLAYVIYTSGSTGKPKGVKITHSNVINLFTALNQRFKPNPNQDIWLAVTSISFDISVLELFWTLCNGNHVVIQPDMSTAANNPSEMDFSLFYFAAEEASSNKYRLLLEGAKFADKNNLSGIWIPERHFHSFGDQFPNPSVAAAAVAAITERIKIRSGSVVLPLHDPIRVAEEWSMVDNISNGRVEMSVASGWHPNDFVLSPSDFPERHQLMKDKLKTVQSLWEGNSIIRINGIGKEFKLKTHPQPIQKTLPVWMTAAGNPDTFRYAGSIGANVLTHFLGQSKDELKGKITIYRKALVENGFDPEHGKVALMLHTFISDDATLVEKTVKGPFKNYLRHSLGLVKPVAEDHKLDIDSHQEEVIELAYQRYFQTSGLFGTPEHCLDLALDLMACGVNEIACLIDFGIEHSTTLTHLPQLNNLQSMIKPKIQQYRFLAKRNNHSWSSEELIRKHGITHMQCTPSFIRGWAKTPEGQSALGQLKTLFVGGEALEADVAELLTQYVAGEVYNMYGPTETTVWSAVSTVNTGPVSIGGPIGNTRFYVLDEHQQLLPIGVPGELYIGGSGLSAGYYKRDKLSREKFIINPFSDNPEEKLYRTGDRVRWLANGELEFINRIDHQVKVRGFRIELGEIESVITAHQAIDTCVVLSREDVPGNKRLVAYIVYNKEKNLADIDILRSHLRRQLPDYMVPEVFISMQQLPLTPNNKVDRNALPPPGRESMSEGEFTPPQTENEIKLQLIWQDLLYTDLENIGIHDGFFRLGGNSLLSIQMISRIKQSFHVSVSIRDIFEHQTISALAKHIGNSKSKQLLPLEPVDYSQGVPASFTQQMFWYVHHLPGKFRTYYNLVNTIKIEGALQKKALQDSVQHIINSHQSLKAYYSLENKNQLRMHIRDKETLNWRYEDFSGLEKSIQEQKIAEFQRTELNTELSLTQGPLLRTVLLKFSEHHYVFILTLHHIAADGWSQNIIKKELSENYNAIINGNDLKSDKQKIHYSDYAYWLIQWHESDQFQQQLAYWNEKISSLVNPERFPTDYNVPIHTPGIARYLDIHFSDELLNTLNEYCAKSGITLYMVMMAAVHLSLYKYSGISRQVVSTYIAGRSRPELEPSLGQFADSIFIISNINPSTTLLEFIQQIRNSMYEAQDNSEISSVYVRQKTRRDLPTLPIIFNFVDLPNNSAWELANLKVDQLERPDDESPTTVGLEIDVRWTDTGLHSYIAYNSKLFVESTAICIQHNIIELLNRINSDPHQSIEKAINRETITSKQTVNEYSGTNA